MQYCIFLFWRSSILYVKIYARYHGLVSDVKICREWISVVPECQNIEECPAGEKERWHYITFIICYNGKTLKFNWSNFVNLHHWKNNKQEKPNGFSEISSSSPSVGQTSNICGRPELLKILFQENLFFLKLFLFFQTYSLPMIS